MTAMDLKGISWVGDMYNRFESMCVEVDEIIAQDTVKYVENQMLTVGASVKKFYSEVMEDLLLPSSLDPVKEEKPSESEVQHHVDAPISEKTKVLTEGGSVNSIAEQKVKDSDSVANGDNSVNHGISSSVCCVNNPYEPKLHNSVEQQCVSDSLKSQCALKDLDNRQDSEHKSSDISTLNADVEKYSREESTCAEVFSEIDEHLCEVRGVISDLTSVLEVNQRKEGGVGISKGMIEGDGGVDAVEESKTTIAFSGNMSINTTITPGVGLTLTGPVGMSTNVDETLKPSIASEIEGGDANKQGALIFKQLERLRLGESCVLVEKSEHSFKLPLADEQKSYKKRIRDVFSPRRWSKGKRDKEQLALWYEEQTGNKLLPSALKPAGILDSRQDDSLELDWELL